VDWKRSTVTSPILFLPLMSSPIENSVKSIKVVLILKQANRQSSVEFVLHIFLDLDRVGALEMSVPLSTRPVMTNCSPPNRLRFKAELPIIPL